MRLLCEDPLFLAPARVRRSSRFAATGMWVCVGNDLSVVGDCVPHPEISYVTIVSHHPLKNAPHPQFKIQAEYLNGCGLCLSEKSVPFLRQGESGVVGELRGFRGSGHHSGGVQCPPLSFGQCFDCPRTFLPYWFSSGMLILQSSSFLPQRLSILQNSFLPPFPETASSGMNIFLSPSPPTLSSRIQSYHFTLRTPRSTT